MKRGAHTGGQAVWVSLACVLVLAVGAGCGGGSSEDATGGADTSEQATTTTVARTSGPTEAVLRPLGGSKASGRAVYIKKRDGLPLIKLRAKGLGTVHHHRQYLVWQKRSRNDMVLLASWHVGKDHRLVATWEPSIASLDYLEEGLRTKLLITKINNNGRLRQPGAGENSYVHNVIGHPVLEGTFSGSLVGAAEGG